MATISLNRKHLVILLSANLVLLHQVGQTSALHTRSTFPSVFVRQPKTVQEQSTCLCSAASSEVDVDETTGLFDDQSAQSATYDWDEQFEQLESFHAEYGHSNFPQNPPAHLERKYPVLKRFCHDQRQLKEPVGKKMTLVMFDRYVRRRRLEELRFEFIGPFAQWYDHYHEFLEYFNENGHARVTQEDSLSLYNWMLYQRRKRKGKEKKLDDIQIKLLNDIGFEWIPERNDDLWMGKYNELVEFRSKHGHLRVEVDSTLGHWIKYQRRRRDEKKGAAAITDTQIRLLDAIEFSWKPERNDSKWHAKYDELQRFQKKYGNCQPTPSTNFKLYTWVQYQQYRKEYLSTEQIKLLNKINFQWERKVNEWPKMFSELAEYSKKHGHLQVNGEDDPDLYEWMSVQRNRYHGIAEPTMTDQQIETLEAIDFCWSLDWRDRTWHQKYMEAAEFFKQHGDVRVKKKENASLYNWVQAQEKRYKEAKGQKPLSEEELEMLEQLDFPFLAGQPRMAWNAKYSAMERWRQEHNGRFPCFHKDDPNLSRWMRQQKHRLRSEFGYAPLVDEQKSQLETIDFPIYPNSRRLRSWYEKYDKLIEFRNEHGHFVLDPSKNRTLHLWVNRQRRAGLPLNSQIYLLERIGFPWTSDRNEIEWQGKYEELVQFRRDYGHLNPQESGEHSSLSYWVKRQRQRYHGTSGTSQALTEAHISQLEKIGFRWEGKFRNV